MDEKQFRTLTDQLGGISKQLDEVLALLRYNLKKPPSGQPKVHSWPDDETIEKWEREAD
jgi:hypothetical protein